MTYPNDPTATSGQQAADSIRGPATEVKDTAAAEVRQVAQTAKQEARQLTAEGRYQGRRVLDEGLAELRTQASTVQTRLAESLQDLSDELREMTGAGQTNGTAAGLASQAQDYTERAATWLRDNDLDSALAGVRRYAARNPWGFLAIAAGAGLVAGRLARGVRDADSDDAVGGYRETRSHGYAEPNLLGPAGAQQFGEVSELSEHSEPTGDVTPDLGVDRPTNF